MSSVLNRSEQIAAYLLNIGAVALRPQEPFTWTSGIKSPIYCDNRLTLSYPEVRSYIADAFAELISSQFPEAEVIAGTATAGIPHAAWVADKLNLPMAYIRDKAKGHGKQNQIEGLIAAGQKTIIIEDLISTGGSSIKAAEAVQEAGGKSLAVLAIFSYELDRASEAFAASGVPLYSLSNYSTLIDVALSLGKIAPSDVELLQSWRKDPAAFGV